MLKRNMARKIFKCIPVRRELSKQTFSDRLLPIIHKMVSSSPCQILNGTALNKVRHFKNKGISSI